MAITFTENDPIIQRALSVETATSTEVGFIPGDEYGCKIYASRIHGKLVINGMHSHTYGCTHEPKKEAIVILDSPKREVEQLRFNFEDSEEY